TSGRGVGRALYPDRPRHDGRNPGGSLGSAARGRPGPWGLRPGAADRTPAEACTLWARQGSGTRRVDTLGKTRADVARARRARRHRQSDDPSTRRAWARTRTWDLRSSWRGDQDADRGPPDR